MSPVAEEAPVVLPDAEKIRRILALDQSGVLGGAELSLLELAKGLSSMMKVVLFAEGPFQGELTDAGVEVSIAEFGHDKQLRKKSAKISLAVLLSIVRLIREVVRNAKQCDVIYANTQKAMVIGTLAGALARKPVVWHLRDIVSKEHFAFTQLAVIRLLSRFGVRYVIANSQATRKALIDSTQFDDSKIEVVYNGISRRSFDDAQKISVDDIRARFALPLHSPLVGSFSRLAEWKGQHVLLHAIAGLPEVHVALVGTALFGEQQYESELRALVGQLGIENRVHFLGFQRDVPLLMRAMDIVAHTSISPEPFGRVIVEGMLSLRPVIAAKAGGVLEIIEDGCTGLLVEPGDAKELQAAIARLIEQPELVRNITESAYGHALATYDPLSYRAAVKDVLFRVTPMRSTSR